MQSNYSSISSEMDTYEFSLTQNDFIAKYIMTSADYPEFQEILEMSYAEFIDRLIHNQLPDFPRRKKPKFHREVAGIFFNKYEWMYLNRHRLEYMSVDEFRKSGNHVDILFGYSKPVHRENYLAMFERIANINKKR